MDVCESNQRAGNNPQNRCQGYQVEAMAVPVHHEPYDGAEKDGQDSLSGREISGNGLGVALHEDDVGRAGAESTCGATLEKLCRREHQICPRELEQDLPRKHPLVGELVGGDGVCSRRCEPVLGRDNEVIKADVDDVGGEREATQGGRDPKGPSIPTRPIPNGDRHHTGYKAHSTRESILEPKRKGQAGGAKPMIEELPGWT